MVFARRGGHDCRRRMCIPHHRLLGRSHRARLANINVLSVILTALALVALTKFKIDQICIFGCAWSLSPRVH
jgi:hypothetical protein